MLTFLKVIVNYAEPFGLELSKYLLYILLVVRGTGQFLTGLLPSFLFSKVQIAI